MTQCERILDYLKANGSITPLEAMSELGVMRLGARVWELKRQGVGIRRETAAGKNRYGETTRFARYRLECQDAE